MLSLGVWQEAEGEQRAQQGEDCLCSLRHEGRSGSRSKRLTRSCTFRVRPCVVLGTDTVRLSGVISKPKGSGERAGASAP